MNNPFVSSIEGNPFIIRFKTTDEYTYDLYGSEY